MKKTGTILEKSVDAVISNPKSKFVVDKDTFLAKNHTEYFDDTRKQGDENSDVLGIATLHGHVFIDQSCLINQNSP